MDGATRHATVLILYAHPLLGLGLEKLLEGEPELDVLALETHEARAASAALARNPDVVILERGAGMEPSDVVHAAPDALLIDVGLDAGRNFALHREPLAGQADGILEAIRQLRVGSGSALAILAMCAVLALS